MNGRQAAWAGLTPLVTSDPLRSLERQVHREPWSARSAGQS